MKEREMAEEADMNMTGTKRNMKTESRFTKNKQKDIDEMEKEEARDMVEKFADMGEYIWGSGWDIMIGE